MGKILSHDIDYSQRWASAAHTAAAHGQMKAWSTPCPFIAGYSLSPLKSLRHSCCAARAYRLPQFHNQHTGHANFAEWPRRSVASQFLFERGPVGEGKWNGGWLSALTLVLSLCTQTVVNLVWSAPRVYPWRRWGIFLPWAHATSA